MWFNNRSGKQKHWASSHNSNTTKTIEGFSRSIRLFVVFFFKKKGGQVWKCGYLIVLKNNKTAGDY